MTMQRHSMAYGMRLLFVRPAVSLIYLTSINDYNSPRLKKLNELAWHVSSPAKINSTLKARKIQDRNTIEVCFNFNL